MAMPAMPASAGPSAVLAAKYKLTDPDAIAHFEAGNAAYKAGADKRRPRVDRELERAIAEYTAGQAKQDRPVFDYNLGLAYKALGRTNEAIEHLQRFLGRAEVDDTVRAEVEKKIATLDPSGERRAELAKKHATAPAAVAAPPVPAAVEADHPPSTPTAPPLVPPQHISPPGLSATEAAPPRSSVRWTRIGGWGLTAIGLAGAGVTTWLLVDAQSLDNQASDAQANRMVSQRQALTDRASSRRRAAAMVGIGSGVLLTSGAMILVLWSGVDPAPARVGWRLGLTGDGVAISGQF